MVEEGDHASFVLMWMAVDAAGVRGAGDAPECFRVACLAEVGRGQRTHVLLIVLAVDEEHRRRRDSADRFFEVRRGQVIGKTAVPAEITNEVGTSPRRRRPVGPGGMRPRRTCPPARPTQTRSDHLRFRPRLVDRRAARRSRAEQASSPAVLTPRVSTSAHAAAFAGISESAVRQKIAASSTAPVASARAVMPTSSECSTCDGGPGEARLRKRARRRWQLVVRRVRRC
jgi:hypothetical protein